MSAEATRTFRTIPIIAAIVGIGVAPVIGGCGSHTHEPPATVDQHIQHVQRRGPGPGAPTGYWDADGRPVNGGPPGADGSTGNNLGEKYCAENETPACPIGSYAGPNATGDR